MEINKGESFVVVASAKIHILMGEGQRPASQSPPSTRARAWIALRYIPTLQEVKASTLQPSIFPAKKFRRKWYAAKKLRARGGGYA